MRARELLLTGLAAIMAYASPVPARQAPTLARDGSPMLFEGARRIVGDGSAPVERSAFLVEGGRLSRSWMATISGRRPTRATRSSRPAC